MVRCIGRNSDSVQGDRWQDEPLENSGGSSKAKVYEMLRNGYDRYLYPARNAYLGEYLSRFIDSGESLLDIGCAEGTIPYFISQKKDVSVHGVDVFFKRKPLIPFTRYEGGVLPFEDKVFDCSLAVDALHHCEDITGMVKEMMRISDRIIIKDHYFQNGGGLFLLKLFDVSANKPYGINSIFNFKKWDEWVQIFKDLNLDCCYVDKRMDRIKMGPLKHFCVLLEENGGRY